MIIITKKNTHSDTKNYKMHWIGTCSIGNAWKKQMIYTSVMGVALHFTALHVWVCKCRIEREKACVCILNESRRASRGACAFLYERVYVTERGVRKGTHRSVAPVLESLEMLSHCLSPVPAQGLCRDSHAWAQSHTQTHTADVSSLPLLAASDITEWER